MASSRATILLHGGTMRPVATLTGVVLFIAVSLLPGYGLYRVFGGGALELSGMVVVGLCLAGLVAAVWIGVTVARRFDKPEPGPVELDRLPEVLVLSITPSSTSRARLVGPTWRLEVPAGGLLELDAESRPQGVYPVRRHRWHCNGEVMEFSMPLDSTTLSLEPLVEACERLDIRLTVAGDWIACMNIDSDGERSHSTGDAAEQESSEGGIADGRVDAPSGHGDRASTDAYSEPLWPGAR
ncbi:hypothetical protein [Demequina capsici]|uniref:Uncharacterized protein n=1 Tax=Demequina capsici TaxID=3075620 RepID=A0AA96JAT5_9MICO|nr:hypothetical protein [Demequina sp. OYTSA14]WNM25051.1 hypothetical protein RN606_02575 [Demequina sp. OYTSA14]